MSAATFDLSTAAARGAQDARDLVAALREGQQEGVLLNRLTFARWEYGPGYAHAFAREIEKMLVRGSR